MVVVFARERIASAGLADRLDAVVGDATAEPLPEGYDVLLAANLVHYWSSEQTQEFLGRARADVEAGATLLLADFWTDPTHTKPVHAALMAGEFAMHLANGDVYSVDEVQSWLSDTGWQYVRTEPLAGPQSLVVARDV